MTEPIIMQFELARKQMISANDRLHFQQKAKITRFLRELAKYEGQNTLKDWYGFLSEYKNNEKSLTFTAKATNDIRIIFRERQAVQGSGGSVSTS